MKHSNLKKKFECCFEKLLKSKAVQLVTLIVKDYVTCEPSNINACPLPDFVKTTFSYSFLIDMLHIATYKSTASGAFFLGREATERATTS